MRRELARGATFINSLYDELLSLSDGYQGEIGVDSSNGCGSTRR